MCDQSSACNPRWYIRSRESTIKRVHWVSPDLIKHTLDCHGSKIRNVTFKHIHEKCDIQVRNRAPLTARSISLRCVSAAEHQTAEQYSKTGRKKPRKNLPRSTLSWNTRQDFLKIPSLCEAALRKLSKDASQRSSLNQMSWECLWIYELLHIHKWGNNMTWTVGFLPQ